ncbi:MAG: hypothetical protein L0K74_10880, partial [Acidipropionibacterium acidipropionici]|nr:hypothetical protein [Acidipropionibacterium acidipropionici]
MSAQTSPASPTPGPRPVTEIGTLPPIDVVEKRLPVDPATGRPRREILATIATICYILAAGAS